MNYWYSVNVWNVIPCVFTILSIAALFFFLSEILGQKICAPLFLILFAVFRVASRICFNFRYSYLTLSYLREVSTALNVAKEYTDFCSGSDILIFIFIALISIPWILWVKNRRKDFKKLCFSLVLFLPVTTLLTVRAGNFDSCAKDIYFKNFYEGFMQSLKTEIEMTTIDYDIEEEKEKVKAFTSDSWEDIKPNIIGILCESYADVEEAFGITPSRDPLKKYKELEELGCEIGYVTVDTIGGGTANSEWEFQTGLDIGKLPNSQSPYANKCDVNYALSADPLYDDYHKTVIHPYYKNGHNREHVYSVFNYDESRFLEDTEFWKDSDYRRNIISDESIYEKIKEILKRNEPQYITAITMQNHGDYIDIDLENKIEVNEDFGEKERLENYLTLIESSSEDLYEFISYLKEHPEEPTIVFFFGDHFPGGIADPNGNEDFYKTPYMVYANFEEVKDMPDELDLSLLYATGKDAAGLPLTAFEKYLISLNGETVDASMIMARMREGYF